MEKNEDCSVCLCEINYNEIDIIELDCGHNYHKECIDTWLKERNTCPCCRQRASINGINVGNKGPFISSVFVQLHQLRDWNIAHGYSVVH